VFAAIVKGYIFRRKSGLAHISPDVEVVIILADQFSQVLANNCFELDNFFRNFLIMEKNGRSTAQAIARDFCL